VAQLIDVARIDRHSGEIRRQRINKRDRIDLEFAILRLLLTVYCHGEKARGRAEKGDQRDPSVEGVHYVSLLRGLIFGTWLQD